jgi:hypothetical protein
MRYPSDLTDDEWALVAPQIPAEKLLRTQRLSVPEGPSADDPDAGGDGRAKFANCKNPYCDSMATFERPMLANLLIPKAFHSSLGSATQRNHLDSVGEFVVIVPRVSEWGT